MPVDLDSIRQVSLFAHLEEKELAHVAALTIERTYDRGDIILLEGDLGGALHYVHRGLIKVFKTSPDGKEQVLRLITPGLTFNDVPALDGGANPASASAMEESIVYRVGRVELKKLIMERPAVALEVAQTMAKALRHMVALVEDLSFQHVIARVAKLLLEHEALAQAGHQTYRLTHQEMAALAGTAREVIGRALKEIETSGAIELHKGRVTIVDQQKLALFLNT